MAKRRGKFSWSAFLAGVLGVLALGVVAFGAWFWMVHVRDSTDAQFRDRTLNLWIMLTVFLALIAIGLYMLPKQHAKWMSPVQKGVVLALLAHVLLILLTRITEVSQQVAAVVVPQQTTIHIQSAPEVQVSEQIRKQFSELPVQDPTLVHTAKAELPKPKLTRPKSTDAPVPKAQTTPQPLQMQAPQREMAKSTEQAVKTEAKLDAQTPELKQTQQAKPLQQKEATPTVQQKAQMSRAVTEPSAASARLLEQQAQRAKANPSQLSPAARPWQVKAAAESHVKPVTRVTMQAVNIQMAQADNPVAAAAQAKAGPSNPNAKSSTERLAQATGRSAAAGSAKATEVSAAAAHATPGGASLAATPAGVTGKAIAASVEEAVASHTVGVPGIAQVDVSSLMSNAPSQSAVGGESGKQPAEGQTAGLRIANTRLAGNLVSGSAGGAGEIGGGTLGAPTSASGESVATVATLGGGKFSHEIGGAVQPGASVQPSLGDGPELTGPVEPAGGQGSTESGSGTDAGPAEAVPGGSQSEAAGKTYAGRQEASGSGGSYDGDVSVGGDSHGASGTGELGSILASAAGTDPRGSGHGEVVAAGVGVGASIGSPAGVPDVIGVAVGDLTGGRSGGKEGTPGSAIGGPGVLAARATSRGGGPGGGRAQTLGQGGKGELASGLGGTDSLASAAGKVDRRLPPGISSERIGNDTMPIVAVRPDYKPEKTDLPADLPQRTPEAREIIGPEMGDSTGTKQAVADALEFLARCQEPDGRWIQFNGDPDPGNNKPGDRDTALTGLAMLCFLAVDHTPDKQGPYQQTVRNGLEYLLSSQKADGDLRGEGDMYCHGIASLAVIEAALMTGNARSRYRGPAIKAANFIVNAQNPKSGGWRYKPGDDGDTSILGWQVMALYSVQHLGVEVPARVFDGARRWLDHVRSNTAHGALAGYTDRISQPAMSAEAAFSHILMGQQLTQAQQDELSEYLLKFEPGKGRNDLLKRDDFYLWYYTALALLQLQNPAWDTWNQQMQTRVLGLQKKDGVLKGSWDPKSKHAWMGGRVYTTAMATLTLEVYYRYLPIFAKPQKE